MLNSSGYVLIIVLLMTSLMVSVSTEFLIVAQTNINYIRKFSEKLKAGLIARSGIMLSQFVLEADKMGLATGLLQQRASKEIDCYEDLWALNYPEIPIDIGSLKIRITDENSKINLSVLANEVVDKTLYYNVLQRFFLNMGFSGDLADTIIDWVDIDNSRFPYGAETSDYYSTLNPPYSAKNSEMDSIDELLMIKGITPEIFYGLGGGNYGHEENLVDSNTGTKEIDSSLFSDIDNKEKKIDFDVKDLEKKIGREKSRRLSDYLRVHGDRSNYLGELNKININTASYRVLSALTDYMTDDIVTEIIRRRIEQPINSVEDLKDLIEDENVRKNIISVKSYIFKIESIGRVNNTTVTITAYFNRDGKKILYWSEQ